MNKNIQLHGGGKSERAFIHIRDVAEATLSVLQNGINGDAYHISPEGDDISIYSLVEYICEMMNCNFESSVELVDQNYGQDSKYSISSSKLRQELNWKPTVQLSEGQVQVQSRPHKGNEQPLKYNHEQQCPRLLRRL